MTVPRKLGDFVKPPPRPTALDVDRHWWEVRAGLRRRTQLRRAAVVGTGLAALLVAVFAGTRDAKPEVWQAATVTSTTTPVAVALHEGTQVELQPRTSVQVAQQSPEDVLLLLDEGTVRLDVVKNAKRRFVVRAGDVDVQVIGTQFDVRRAGREIAVSVFRGIVEVRTSDQVHRLAAGERWSRAGFAEVQPPAEDTLEEEVVDEVEPPPGQRPPATKRKVKRTRTAPAPVVAAPPQPPPAAPIAEPVPVPTARSLFDSAVSARSKGNAAEAISRFEQLLRDFPKSSFASLSAFELGRLQMDSRRNPRAAAAAFEQVLAIAGDSGLTEDALGRLVEAYASFDVAACRKARARYLSAFPSGTHAKDVTSSCPP